jgi:hypothetical protein
MFICLLILFMYTEPCCHRNNSNNMLLLQNLQETYVFLCVTTTVISFRYGQESSIPLFMASAFSNNLLWTRTSKLRVLGWITYAIIKKRLGPTSTKDWLIACMLVRGELKWLESVRWCLRRLLEARGTWGVSTWIPWHWCEGLGNQTSY